MTNSEITAMLLKKERHDRLSAKIDALLILIINLFKIFPFILTFFL